MSKQENNQAFLDLHQECGLQIETLHGGTLKANVAKGFLANFQPLLQVFDQEAKLPIDQQLASCMETIVLGATSRRELIRQLRQRTERVFQSACNSFITVLSEQDNMRDALMSVTSKMRRLAQQMDRDTEEGCATITVSQVLNFGVSNLTQKIWSYFEVIPHICKGEPHALQPSRYKWIAETTLPLISQIARYHDLVFHSISHFLADGYNGTTPDEWPPLKPECFTIVDDTVEFSDELMKRVREILTTMKAEGELEDIDPWVGCAAVFLFKPIFKWCVRYAERCMFPHVQHIENLPAD
ncbi:hypothetical protein HY213_04895 [Candidatus Peregrinibacteria bacterium]|nr:hypothetical protein [Candidatus Peregrinibacteria bacterium]